MRKNIKKIAFWIFIIIYVILVLTILTPIHIYLNTKIYLYASNTTLILTDILSIILYIYIPQKFKKAKVRILTAISGGIIFSFFIFRIFTPDISTLYLAYSDNKYSESLYQFLGMLLIITFFIAPIIINLFSIFSKRFKKGIKEFIVSVGILILFLLVSMVFYSLTEKIVLKNFLTSLGFVSADETPIINKDYYPEVVISNSLEPILSCLQKESPSWKINLNNTFFGNTVIRGSDIKILKSNNCFIVLYPENKRNNLDSEKRLRQTINVAESLIKIKLGEYIPPEKFDKKTKFTIVDNFESNNQDGEYYRKENKIEIKSNDRILSTVIHEMLHSLSSPDFNNFNGFGMNESMTTYLNQEVLQSMNVSYDKVEYSRLINEAIVELGKYTDLETLKNAYFNDGRIETEKIIKKVDTLSYPNAYCHFTVKLANAISIIQNGKSDNTLIKEAIQVLHEPDLSFRNVTCW